MKSVVRVIAVASGMLLALAAQAATVTIAEVSPNTSLQVGVESQDGVNSGPAALSGITPLFAGYRLEIIEWWGYDLANPTNAGAPFQVTFNGSIVAGNLTRSSAGLLAATPNDPADVTLYLYSLDLDDAVVVPVAAGNDLALWNIDLDSEWYWQTSGSGREADMAFRLLASEPDGRLPEPGSLALVAAAGVGVVALRRRKSAAVETAR